MSSLGNKIGFSQRVRLEWFDQTAKLVLAGNDKAAVNDALQELLKDKVSVGSSARGCNRNKVISILRRVWVSPPEKLIHLRNEGLRFLSTQSSSLSPRHLSVAIHWGMVMAVYPFWSSVATQTGRLLRLQGSVVAAQVQRRIREQYGERETVSRATQRMLRSYLDWGVLQETSRKGIYSAGATLTIEDARLITWLVESSLHTRASGLAQLKELIGGPNLFPFRIEPIQAESLVAASSRLDLFRNGLDDDFVVLRKQTNA